MFLCHLSVAISTIVTLITNFTQTISALIESNRSLETNTKILGCTQHFTFISLFTQHDDDGAHVKERHDSKQTFLSNFLDILWPKGTCYLVRS